MSCSTCWELCPPTLDSLQDGQMATLFIAIHDLEISINEVSCKFCRLIWDALCLFKHRWDEHDRASFLEIRVARNKPLQLSYWSRQREGSVNIELFTRKGDDYPETPHFPTIGSAKEVSPRSDSDDCLRLANSWMRDCLAIHSSCGSSDAVSLPTRVIAVGTEGEDPYLNECNGQRGTYVALSYCWGDPQLHTPLKTTDDNYNRHKQCIRYNDMPKTFQDAVLLCRRLGVEYLWIDALCIIQGNPKDWAREASKMCGVYSNAILTIAVDSAEGSSDGIFVDQKFGIVQLQHLDGRPIYIRKQLAREHHHQSLSLKTPSINLISNPILKRGWCLQEAMLSNRILHYTSEEIVWECNEIRRCECDSLYDIGPDTMFIRTLRRPGDLGSYSLQTAYKQWQDILHIYSQRSLSLDTDKLPALSGLAEQFNAMLRVTTGRSEKYVAGMWAGDLATSLLWHVQDDNHELGRDGIKFNGIHWRRPHIWRAPTWSMMAIEGPVHLAPWTTWTSEIEVVDVFIELTDPILAPYGSLRSGSLVLCGRVVYGLKMLTVQARNRLKGAINDKRYLILDPKRKTHVILCDDPPSLSLGADEFACLYMGHEYTSKGSEAYWHPFLVLRKSESVPDAFERVGISDRGQQNDDIDIGTQNSNTKQLFEGAPRELVKII